MKKAIAAAAICSLTACAATEQDPNSGAADIIFRNGLVYADNMAEAVTVSNGKIQFIGSNADALQYQDEQTKVIDLKGKLLLPGFIDNHSHLGEGGEVTCLPKDHLTIEQQASQLAKCARGVAKGKWIIGYGMHLEVVLGENEIMNHPLTTLDEIFPDNPVIIMEQTSHSMFVNSLALAEAGFTKNTPHPQGGKIMKDEQGELNGVLVDNAGDIVMEIAVNAVDNKFDVFYEGILYGLDEAKKNGITTVGDGRTYWRRGMYDAWKEVESNNDLTARISLRPWIYPTVAINEQLQFLENAYQNDLEKLLLVNQVKMYSDGVPENGTARVILPYKLTWFPESPYGINYIPQHQMETWLTELNTLGYGAHIHALGDQGVRETLNAIEKVRDEGSVRTYNMTHLAMVDGDDVARFAELNVDADIQVAEALSSHAIRQRDFEPLIGKQRAAEILYRPLKELQDSGANVVLSSDWTVQPMSPLLAISYTVEEGSFTIEQAIDAYTINPAKALGLASITGSIEIGKSADFVVLNQDITQLSAKQILDAKVTMTVLQGEIVYE